MWQVTESHLGQFRVNWTFQERAYGSLESSLFALIRSESAPAILVDGQLPNPNLLGDVFNMTPSGASSLNLQLGFFWGWVVLMQEEEARWEFSFDPSWFLFVSSRCRVKILLLLISRHNFLKCREDFRSFLQLGLCFRCSCRSYLWLKASPPVGQSQ